MNNADIIRGNIFILRFMGIKGYYLGSDEESIYVANGERVKFHTDWNWLMMVVEKIETLHDEHHGYFGVHISSNTCSIQGTNLWQAIQDPEGYGAVYMSDPNAVLETKLLSTWYQAVQFIKWYLNNPTL